MTVGLSRRIAVFVVQTVTKLKEKLMGEPRQPSVLAGMPTFDWNSDRSVRYEVAQEAIGQAVAAYTVLINKAADEGDKAREAALSELQRACIKELNQLRSNDPATLDTIVGRYRDLIVELRAQAA